MHTQRSSTQRVVILGVVAVALIGYMVAMGGTWLLAIAIATVLSAMAVIALLFKLTRLRRVSMRTLVFVVPLVTALVAMLLNELTKSQRQQALVNAAGVHTLHVSEGMYGGLNAILAHWLGASYRNSFPTDIQEVDFSFDCPNVAKLDQLPLGRLRQVRMFQLRASGSMSSSTLDWLNRLPGEVDIHLYSNAMTFAKAVSLQKLRRPLTSLRISSSLSDDELAAVLSIPTESLGMSGVTKSLTSPDELSVTPTQTRQLSLYVLPSTLAVKIARWKQCTILTCMNELSVEDCESLAALKLEELKVSALDIEQLQILLKSESLQRLNAGVRVRGISEAQRKELEASAPSHIKVRLARLP